MDASRRESWGGTSICPLKSKFKVKIYIKYTLQNLVYIPPKPLHTNTELLVGFFPAENI
jgi:hypothetical protein